MFSVHKVFFSLLICFSVLFWGCERTPGPAGPPDLTVPVVMSTSPADHLNGILTSSSITIVFNMNMDQSSITASTLDVKQSGASVSGTISFPGPESVRFIPSSPFDCLAVCTVTVKMGVKGSNGIAMAEDHVFSFETVPVQAYFIDPSAPSGGTGTPAAPFKSWAGIFFVPGYAYLQKRGSIAREQITVNTSGLPSGKIVIGAYGEGAAPVVQGSDIETGWTVHSGSVYCKSVTLAVGERLGMVAQDSVPLKFIAWDTDLSTACAKATEGSYFYNSDSSTLYVRCSGNVDPNTRTMEVSRRLFGLRGEGISHLRVENLHFRYTSFHGISFVDVKNVDVRGCTMEKLGGGVVRSSPSPVYAGNGIEFGNASAHCSVTGCVINDIFDSGISPQTFDSGKAASDFTFSDSTVSRCGFAGVEISVLSNGGSWTNSTIRDVTVSNLAITDCGKGWSGTRYKDVKTDNPGEGRGIRIGVDTGTGNAMSGIFIQTVSVSGSEGSGIMIFGEAGAVNVNRSRIFNNNRDGIEVSDGPSTSLGLKVSSSLISGNGTNGGSNNRFGISYYSPSGAGLDLFHNTFSDNIYIGLALWNSPNVDARNNLFYSTGEAVHLYSNTALIGAVFDYNCYREHGGPIIGIAGVPYGTITAFHAATALESHGFGSGNPGVNTDLTLLSTSPCRGSGVAGTGVTIDYTGKTFGSPPSIGAYEY